MTIEWDLIFVCVHSRCALVRVLFDGANECIRYIDIDQSSCPKSFIPALKYIHNIFFTLFDGCRYGEWAKLYSIWNEIRNSVRLSSNFT